MRVLCVSETGYSLGFASHLSSEGHGVTFLIPTSEVGNGIVDTISSLEAVDDIPSDIVIIDYLHSGKSIDRLRAQGKKVIGPSLWSTTVDSDSEYCKRLIDSIGWDTTKVTNGTNMYLTTWFNGMDFISTYASLLYKRLMPGGAGVDVGYSGVLSNFYQPTERVYNTFLKPLQKVLKRVNHRGCIHLKIVIKGNDYSIKEMSTSISNPLALSLFENSKLSVGDLILDLFDETSKPVQPLEQWSGALQLSVPPYPYHIEHSPVTLRGIQPENLKHLWLIDVKKMKNVWTTAGLSGRIGYVTARGITTNEVRRRILKTISNLMIPDLQYRNDIGRKIDPMLDELSRNGWMKVIIPEGVR